MSENGGKCKGQKDCYKRSPECGKDLPDGREMGQKKEDISVMGLWCRGLVYQDKLEAREKWPVGAEGLKSYCQNRKAGG